VTSKFGAKLKEHRMSQGLTLREFCARGGFEPGNYSKLERGLFSPPGADKVDEYARALGIEAGSDAHIELRDLAAVDRGQLPHDLLSDEQVVDELPVLFRTLRGQKVDHKQMDDLVALIRRR
jgi:transcriptional regulator with XRE-family HTH domain